MFSWRNLRYWLDINVKHPVFEHEISPPKNWCLSLLETWPFFLVTAGSQVARRGNAVHWNCWQTRRGDPGCRSSFRESDQRSTCETLGGFQLGKWGPWSLDGGISEGKSQSEMDDEGWYDPYDELETSSKFFGVLIGGWWEFLVIKWFLGGMYVYIYICII